VKGGFIGLEDGWVVEWSSALTSAADIERSKNRRKHPAEAADRRLIICKSASSLQ